MDCLKYIIIAIQIDRGKGISLAGAKKKFKTILFIILKLLLNDKKLVQLCTAIGYLMVTT